VSAAFEALASLPGQIGKRVAGLGFGVWAGKKLGGSGMLGDGLRWARAAPQKGLLNAGTRVWVSQIEGRTVSGVGSALLRTAEKSVVTTLSLEAGIGLGSVMSGSVTCTQWLACTQRPVGMPGRVLSGSGHSLPVADSRTCFSCFRGIRIC
jgi:hypothetical protein